MGGEARTPAVSAGGIFNFVTENCAEFHQIIRRKGSVNVNESDRRELHAEFETESHAYLAAGQRLGWSRVSMML